MVAETLEMRVKDPRLGLHHDHRRPGDRRPAAGDGLLHGLGDESERAATAAALESAKGVLRSEVGRQTGVRLTPTLTFVADAVPENAAHIEDLLAKARRADAEVQRRRRRRDVRRRRRPVPGPRARTRTTDDDADDARCRRPTTGRRVRRADGLVIVDKPAGLTSHDVVARVRRLAGTRRVGHAGTLDPMATGVLVLGVDRATRLLGHLALTEKAYDAHDPARRDHRHRRRRGRGRSSTAAADRRRPTTRSRPASPR